MFYASTIGVYVDMRAYFITTILIIPVGTIIKIFSWLAICYGGSLNFTSSLLYA